MKSIKKPMTMVCYSESGPLAKREAARIRNDGGNANIRNAVILKEWEPVDRVLLMPCVSAHDEARLQELYNVKIERLGVANPAPPPTPAPEPISTKMSDDEAKAILSAHLDAVEAADDASSEPIDEEVPARRPRGRPPGRRAHNSAE